MAEEEPEAPGRSKIVAGGWTLVASGLVIALPFLLMATSPPEGGQGWMGAFMLIGCVPISVILGIVGLIVLAVGNKQASSAPATEATSIKPMVRSVPTMVKFPAA